MKTIFKISFIIIALVFMLIADVPLVLEQLVPEAHAILGVRRRALRRGVVIGASMSAASATAAASQQQAAAAQQQTAATQQQAATTASAPPPPATPGKPLPLGAVVSALPTGCTAAPSGGKEYYHCGDNYYRAVFQGNNLVYVTAKPQ